MVCCRAVLAVILGAAIAACTTSPGPPQPQAAVPSGSPQITNLPVGPSAVAASATPSAPSPTPAATPTPKSTPLPVPSKPSGLEFETPCLLDCDPDDLGNYRLTWKAPRTKGVEIRVYGVTKCFRTDDPEGECLRVHTAVPDDIRVLLAKGPASKGVLDLDIDGPEDADQTEEGCTTFLRTEAGTKFYSIVVAAYDANGHSIFAIANPGGYMAGECPIVIY